MTRQAALVGYLLGRGADVVRLNPTLYVCDCQSLFISELSFVVGAIVLVIDAVHGCVSALLLGGQGRRPLAPHVIVMRS
jgi:hypothetical protein